MDDNEKEGYREEVLVILAEECAEVTQEACKLLRFGYTTDNAKRLVDTLHQREVNMNDKIYSPEHYTSGEVECIDAIEASMSKEEFQGFCKGNVMKYLWRWKHKGGVESLEKAKVYLDWLIATEKFK